MKTGQLTGQFGALKSQRSLDKDTLFDKLFLNVCITSNAGPKPKCLRDSRNMKRSN